MGRRGKGKREQERQAPRAVPSRREPVELDELRPYATPIGGVPIEEREGVFVHSFMCNECNLHFNVYSWKANRHGVRNVTCPECGQSEGRFRHFRAVINESDEMTTDVATEVHGHCAFPGATFMDDSRMPDPTGGD